MPRLSIPIQPKRRKTPDQRREELRESLWPGSSSSIWHRKTNNGFITLPRVVPLVMHLIKELCRKGDPSVVYLELWASGSDEGILTITDENSHAYAAGYAGSRALRTWR